MKSLFTKTSLIFLFLLFINCDKLVDSFFSDKDDVNLGQTLDKEIRAANSSKILDGKEIQKYVQNIVLTILKSNSVNKKKVYPYTVTVIQDDEVINAYCTPGGFIYVFTGLIKFLENEASLAAILAHEIAHAEKRHSRKRMISAISIQVIVSLLLGRDASWISQWLMSFAGEMAILNNSRKDELEADDLAFIYLNATPYYQGSMSYFFDKIDKTEKKSKSSKVLEKILSTHPMAEDRLKANEKRIKKYKLSKPSESNLFSHRYKTTIKKLDLNPDPIIETQDEE